MRQGEEISSGCSMAKESLVPPGSRSPLAEVRMIPSSLPLGLKRGSEYELLQLFQHL